ncbi:hypothetical protein L2U69_07345 [Zavarzinia compransoris]|uniref:hypothetical protein n=1 Tax=Zavarzinia marina TaxID=2911065 RepID=UPI001F1F2F61|nr:hypothetical protein [Zavarzinia marina]MCF4165453.1 hypothetical protein [Zavarzinia marina]
MTDHLEGPPSLEDPDFVPRPLRAGFRACLSVDGLIAATFIGLVALLPYGLMPYLGIEVRRLDFGPTVDSIPYGLAGIAFEMLGVVLGAHFLARIICRITDRPVVVGRALLLRVGFSYLVVRWLSSAIFAVGGVIGIQLAVATGVGALALPIIGIGLYLGIRVMIGGLFLIPESALVEHYNMSAAFDAASVVLWRLLLIGIIFAAVFLLPAVFILVGVVSAIHGDLPTRDRDALAMMAGPYLPFLGLAYGFTFVAVVAASTELYRKWAFVRRWQRAVAARQAATEQ